MRLIYAGHCLDNAKTLREIFNKRHEGMEGTDLGPQVMHMVCAPLPQLSSAKPTMESTLRKRPTASNSTPNMYSSAQFQPSSSEQQVPLPQGPAYNYPYGFQNTNDNTSAYMHYVAAYQN